MIRSLAPPTLLALGLALLLAHVAGSSFALYGGDLWLDPVSHARAVFEEGPFAELRRDAANNDQPFVGYAVRKYLWAPLLGRSERAARLPSTVERMALVLAVALFTFFLFRGRTRSDLVPPLFAAVTGLWAASHGPLLALSAEGRHYVLTALLSCLWAGFAFVVPRRTHPGFFALSWLFANTHLFGLVLVVALYGVDTLVAFARKDRAAGRRAALAATALVILFFVLNPELIPRWQRRVSFQMDRRPLDTPAAKSWTDFLHFQGLPWWPWAFVVLPFLRSRPGNARLALFLFVGVPVFAVAANHLIPVRLKPRYFSPFLGLGFACLCLTLDTLGRRRGFLGAAALAVALGAGLAPERVPESIAGLLESPWPPANASAGYRVSRSLQSVGLPAVWLSAHGERGYGPVIDGFHWALVGDPKAPPALFLPLRDKGPGSAWGRLPPFLRRHGDVLVVLQRGGRRFRCPEPPEDARLRVVEVRLADRCLVLVRGVREIDQVRRLARAVSDTLEPRPGRRRRLDAG